MSSLFKLSSSLVRGQCLRQFHATGSLRIIELPGTRKFRQGAEAVTIRPQFDPGSFRHKQPLMNEEQVSFQSPDGMPEDHPALNYDREDTVVKDEEGL